ncbi:MAG: RluA family pseudouridine synthase [Piscirickettsiaceae bacterium]|nr:RluA family pseudouridine synthase [Piscirickettsiaceae bacterium]
MINPFFTPLEQPLTIGLPDSFTYPFYYEPHPLCLQAAEQLQQVLRSDAQFSQTEEGKMFGVIVVQNEVGDIGYLSAFSGQMTDKNNYFVPALFDLNASSFFQSGQIEINAINKTLSVLESNPSLANLALELDQQENLAKAEIAKYRQEIILGRKVRKEKRTGGLAAYSDGDYQTLLMVLAKQSVAEKNQLKALTEAWHLKLDKKRQALSAITDEIDGLRSKRKQRSHALQHRLFEQYSFLNANGEKRTLLSLFEQTVQGKPPAAAGDCAGPKLLQYAYQHKMTPLAMAEFWWGGSPKSEIRHHGQFYGACQGKCKPILTHMLQGLEVEANPLLNNLGKDKQLEFVYQDDVMAIINKPAELLSVPGKQIQDCVYTRLRTLFPDATGPLIVHRLDMSTSGLMVIALNKQVHKKLQQQFIGRIVKKRYVAILDGLIEQQSGLIDLPLRVDLEDRPRQLVCYDYGKAAQTKWEVIAVEKGRSRVHFYPVTGRTHQLRVHSAHNWGLSTPILGDDLYGKKASRLHLHAETLEFEHPKTKEWLSFQVAADF